MREIEYRGWDSHNKRWVYGLLLMDVKGHYRIQYDPRQFSVIVDPDSIGEYTGIKDKNNKKIYEGDIILTQGQNRRFIQVVEFHNTRETCGRGWVGVNHKTVDNFGHDNPVQGGFSYSPMPCHCEIIGNIHENPELLKTE
jgi:uncharacterized phage protein (TIGR01671 family)